MTSQNCSPAYAQRTSSNLLPGRSYGPQAVGPKQVVCEKSYVLQWAAPQFELLAHGSEQNWFPALSATQQ